MLSLARSLALCCGTLAAAQQLVVLDGSVATGGAGAYDAARGRLVELTRDGVTWERDGAARLHRVVLGPGGPVGRTRQAMAYDAARGHVLLFGGLASAALGDTWTWDGRRWRQPFSTLSPPRRMDAGMTYDPVRRRVVLFGGVDSGNVFRPVSRFDTWEHDGTRWLQRQPATAPQATAPVLGFDAGRGVVVMVAGTAGGAPLDVWQWNGADWTLRPVTGARPASRINQAFAYDPGRQRFVMAGGLPTPTELWEYDPAASRWSPQPALPEARDEMTGWHDPDRGAVVLAAGRLGHGGYADDLWTWDGSRLVVQPPRGPVQQRYGHGWLSDPARGGAVLFGGYTRTWLGDTWWFDGRAWHQAPPAVAPSPRLGAATTVDRVAGRGLLFGGFGLAGMSAELWEWAAGSWRQLASGGGPSPRYGAGLAFDESRAVVVLFGGFQGGPPGAPRLDDLWEWNGVQWRRPVVSARPPGREGHAMAYDPVSARTVVYGGYSGGWLGDLWEWDGVAWSAVNPRTPPPVLERPSMAFDQRRQELVVAGKLANASPARLELLVYRPPDLRPLHSAPAPLAGELELAWDHARGELLLFDGSTVQVWTDVAATAAEVGAGCGAAPPAPPPALAPRTRPRLGEPEFGLEVRATANSAVLVALSDQVAPPGTGGCTVAIGPVVAIALRLADALGNAAQPLPLPSDPALRGLVLYAQAGALAPGTAQPGLSNGLMLVLGG